MKKLIKIFVIEYCIIITGICANAGVLSTFPFQTDDIDRSNILWYQQPAGIWTEALPVGNGRLGGMIYGSVQTEHIQLNEDTFWSGDYVDRNNPKSLENLPKIRSLLLRGSIRMLLSWQTAL